MADRYCGEKHGNFSYACSEDYGQCKDCKIEQLEEESKRLKEALFEARYLVKAHAETLLYPEYVVVKNRADKL